MLYEPSCAESSAVAVVGLGGWRLSGGEESLGGCIGFSQSPGCNVGQEKWYILCQRHPSGVPWTTCPRRHGKSPTTQSRRPLAINPNFGLRKHL